VEDNNVSADPPHPLVAGIDVGGTKKGFHAVLLAGDRVVESVRKKTAEAAHEWCIASGAAAVGIDAPCRWSLTGRARPAERAMAAERISSHATPSLEKAKSRAFYRWMLNGAELFRLVEQTHPLFVGGPVGANVKLCFETFPHAVACALAGKVVSAKQKRTERPALLDQAGVDTSILKSIDAIDAALCALTARHFLGGTFKTYGDSESGLIVVPLHALPA